MCRIAAYFGPPVRLSSLLTGPPHGLVHQSYAPREMTDGTLKADGWGIGWFAPALGPRPGVLKGTQPIWSDENATAATHAIASGAIVAAVRGASAGLGVAAMNTPPFAWEDCLLAHNGRLWPWPGALARDLRDRLDPEDEAALRGTTDSELLGALWRTELRRRPGGDPAEALGACLRVAAARARAHGGGLGATVVIGWATGLLAARFAGAGPPPTLYVDYPAPDRPGGTRVASEPLDDMARWEVVPPASLVRIDARGVRIEPLT